MESGESSTKTKTNPTQQPTTDCKTSQQSFLKPFTKKNWDAIIDEFEKEEEQNQGVNEMFQKIYESGNEDVRRAMNKSFQESGGTVLSTNWSNVAEKKVEPKPPSSNDDKPIDGFDL